MILRGEKWSSMKDQVDGLPPVDLTGLPGNLGWSATEKSCPYPGHAPSNLHLQYQLFLNVYYFVKKNVFQWTTKKGQGIIYFEEG